MASGLTHMLLSKKHYLELHDGEGLKAVLKRGIYAFQVGSVAPDLPYASIFDEHFLDNDSYQADKFHYEKTNQVPLIALQELKELKEKTDDNVFDNMFSFFLGYISHIVADGVIHPFVRDKVGEYEENKSEHRTLEMQLDVLVNDEFSEITGLDNELNHANVHNEFLKFTEENGKTETLQLFSKLVQEVYNEEHTVEDISDWIEAIHLMFEFAEGDYPKILDFLEDNSLTYKDKSEIDVEKTTILSKPKDWDVNFLKKDRISFFEDCVPQFYKIFSSIADKAFGYIYENGEELTQKDLPLINLDTGKLIDDKPELWK